MQRMRFGRVADKFESHQSGIEIAFCAMFAMNLISGLNRTRVELKFVNQDVQWACAHLV